MTKEQFEAIKEMRDAINEIFNATENGEAPIDKFVTPLENISEGIADLLDLIDAGIEEDEEMEEAPDSDEVP